MTAYPSAWRFTGLHWESAQPVLTAAPVFRPRGDAGDEQRRSATAGERVGWRLTEPRTCVGVWSGASRRACPVSAPIPAKGTDAQCQTCARADRGRQIARDAPSVDDDRKFLLYLAYFGPAGLIKIGLTAAERGRDRLLEQGAITFVVLAAGSYEVVRNAEKSVAAARLATERVTAKAKAAAWRNLPPREERVAALCAVRDRLVGRVFWPEGIAFRSGDPVDQAADFGLDKPLTTSWREVTEISDSAVLCGHIRAVIGRQLILDTPHSGLLLCDMRRAAGWTIHPLLAHCDPSGLGLAAGPESGGFDEGQESLF